MPDAATIKDALIIVALLIIFARWTLRWRDKKYSAGNGRSGDMSPSWWELTFTRIFEQVLRDHDKEFYEQDRIAAATERRQLQVKLNQLAAQFELSVQEKQRQLAEAIVEIKRQLREGNHKDEPRR